jgi:5'(3')-deoxyribonucleotidase
LASGDMTSNGRLLVDLDDTCLASADILQAYLEGECALPPSRSRLRDTHDIVKQYGLTIEQTMALVTKFHRSHWMDKLPPLPCAATVLPELHRQGYQFVAITACLNEPEVVEARLRNLTRAFGFEWQAIHCIGLNPSKKAALEAYPPSLWVDDLAHHAIAGAEAGHRSFLIDKPYNQHHDHPKVTRVSDWHDLQQRLENR